MSNHKGTIGILTGGGDVPGLNPAIAGRDFSGDPRGLPGAGYSPRLGRAWLIWSPTRTPTTPLTCRS